MKARLDEGLENGNKEIEIIDAYVHMVQHSPDYTSLA